MDSSLPLLSSSSSSAASSSSSSSSASSAAPAASAALRRAGDDGCAFAQPAFCPTCGNCLAAGRAEASGLVFFECACCRRVSSDREVWGGEGDGGLSVFWRKKTVRELAAVEDRAEIKEACVACGFDTLFFKAVQTRSADEGCTIFYECKSCRHTWTVHN